LKSLAKYAVDNFRAGLEWNAKGGSVTTFKAGGGASAAPAAPAAPEAPSAPEAPMAPPDAPSAPAGDGSSSSGGGGSSGMSAVFDQLKMGGDGVTSGLKKVTNDMKSKNQTNKPVLEAKQKEEKKSAPVAAAKQKKPAETRFAKGTWFVENYDSGEVTVSPVQLKENVYILNCSNVVVNVPDKCKSIQLDTCKKVHCNFKSVVSMVELVNTHSSKIECSDSIPQVAIDKCSGISVILSKSAYQSPPGIITSMTSEINVVIPGKSDEDDPVELPLPEQFLHKLIDRHVHSESVQHSSGG